MTVTFIDTSILCELVGVPGMCERQAEIEAEFRTRVELGERFVIPVTAMIETGNHIEQANGNRRAAALVFTSLLRAAIDGQSPFRLWRSPWDDEFLGALCDGNSTGQSFVDLATNGLLGAGDVAILVERDRFVAETAFSRGDVDIWTLDAALAAHS